MNTILTLMTPEILAFSLLVALLAGVVKGMVGFAMPMIMISLLGSFVAPDVALAGLILPTLLTNGMQALRQGWREAWSSIKRFRLFMAIGLVAMLISAQLVRVLPQEALLLMIGLPVVLFCAVQLLGWQLRLPQKGRGLIEGGIGGIAGFIGGFSGVWGPPTVMYLTALDTPKAESMRVQGVIYGLGAVALFGAHVGSGVMRAETLPFSLAMIVPAMLGTWLGFQVQDRIDQRAFRKATLAVLLIAGLNLVRRGLVG
jgi:uncharacterized membrane protein YfcA